MKLEGKIKSQYYSLKKNKNLAELIGVVLGDGHICRFERTESLRIVGNANSPYFVRHYAQIMEKVFNKKPYVAKMQRKEKHLKRLILQFMKNTSVIEGFQFHAGF